MQINQQKEEFSYAYVYTISINAGYSFQITTRPLDAEGIDAVITGIGPMGSIRHPRLDLQIKSTSQNLIDGEYIKFPLTKKNYDELRLDKPFVPRLLILVLLPNQPNDWLKQTPQELCLKSCGYWVSIRGYPPMPNKNTVTIQIPRDQVFSPQSLVEIMQRITIEGVL
ncbi:MAG: DUF4365 domain-containing protein [Microcoleaceae cyanobacterium]